jgi:hypothetical protein
MKYIIDEEELFFLICESEYRDRKTILINIKESRKPVELISSGKISMSWDDILMYPDIKPDDLAKYIGSEVNFYIEVKAGKE